uniref:ATP synthase complex subunit 8 n=1 Tax=Hexacentrus japonicus TaxID=441225 RepID=A0A1Q1MP15_9ORTH|nr:ATP synthase F0 subunit 8 [Hexacentrus japonicus]AQM39827.1 ATP synthase F0 subunit 8 [Hexacentrus japonicus]
MPQMAPMWWILLYMLFTLSLIVFSVLNYSFLMPESNYLMSKTNLSKTLLNWKW